MTEQQLRDVLARVVPEPPDSVTDAAPVGRAARRQRRARVAALGVLAAAVAGGVVLGAGLVSGDSEERNLVAEQPAISDPYSTAPCPDPVAAWEASPVTDLGAVTAVRYCSRPFNGFPAPEGPADALVDDLPAFVSAVRALPEADPARCAAVSILPVDSRLLVQLGDGTSLGIAAGFCQDVVVEGRTLDGNAVTEVLFSALRGQRDANDYRPPTIDVDVSCAASHVSPAQPGHASIVEAGVCSDSDAALRELDEAGVAALDAAWAAGRPAGTCDEGVPTSDPTFVLALTDLGDVVRLSVHPCGYLLFEGNGTTLPKASVKVPVSLADLEATD